MENSQGNSAKPPMSRTTDGTAVAMIVESIATNAVVSITAMRIGPRSDRSLTLLDVATRNLPAHRPHDAAPVPSGPRSHSVGTHASGRPTGSAIALLRVLI